MVYLMISDCGKFGKIGFTTQTAEQRRKSIQTIFKIDIPELYFIKGTEMKERQLHRMFERFLVAFEWFELDESILSYFKENWTSHQKYNIETRISQEGDETTKDKIVNRSKNWYASKDFEDLTKIG